MPDSSNIKASLHTPVGSGGIAVITLSGSGAAEILRSVFNSGGNSDSEKFLSTGRLSLGEITDGGSRIDEAIIARTSDERECFEINIHGGPQAVRSVLKLLEDRGANVCKLADMAEADVFNPVCDRLVNPAIGREMLGLVCTGASVKAMEMLSAQWTCGLSSEIDRIIHLLETASSNFDPAEISASIRQMAERFNIAKQLLAVPTVVFAGPPNAGKSSLVNAISAREVAIVSPHAGTTRDWLESCVDIDGFTMRLIDTAGLFDGEHILDASSIEKAWEMIAGADLVVAVCDASMAGSSVENFTGSLADGHFDRLLQCENVILAANKCDIADSCPENAIAVSAASGLGLDCLVAEIKTALTLADIDIASPMAFTQRQYDLLTVAADALGSGNLPSALGKLRQIMGRCCNCDA